MKKTLILLRGLPGSGKSSFAKTFLGKESTFEADEYFYDFQGNYNFDSTKLGLAHESCQKAIRARMEYAKMYGSFEYDTLIVANTSPTEKELQPYLDLAEEFGYEVISLVIENRHGGKSVHNVPDSTIEKMKNRFQIKL